MASLVAGLAGGLVATVLMTAVMMALGDGGPPPTAALVAKFQGGDPADHAMPGMVLHLVYGTVAGAVLAVAAPAVGLTLVDSTGLAVGVGLVYGLLLMVSGMVFWMRVVIGLDPERETVLVFGVVHVVYGVVLGAFLGAGLV